MKTWLILLIRVVSIVIGVSACFGIDWMSHNQVAVGPGLHFAILPTNEYISRIFALAGLYVTLAVSLNLINGITGQFSVGHAAFYQIGAYLAGFVSLTYYGFMGLTGLPWLLAMMVLGGLGAGVAGFVVGLPSLRLRGDYLAIVTLGFGEIIRIIVQNVDKLGGAYGLNVSPKFQMIWLIWLLAFVCIAVCRNLLRTAHGLPFLAVREDEVAAAAMGVNVTKVKVVAFIVGSTFAGAAGALLAHYEGFINPGTFAMDVSFIILTMVVLGGSGSITGATVAAILLSWLPEFLRGVKNADGSALMLSDSSIIAALLATGIGVALIKRFLDRPPFKWRYLAVTGCFLGALVLKLVIQRLLNLSPALSVAHIEAGQIRMVIFAVTLIVIMLLRPQGIFGHHEFSLAWVKGIWRRLFPRRGVSA